MTIAMKYTAGRWMGIGAPLLLGIAVAGALVLHLAFGLAWGVLAFPVSVYAALQVVCYAAMFWVEKRDPTNRICNLGPILLGHGTHRNPLRLALASGSRSGRPRLPVVRHCCSHRNGDSSDSHAAECFRCGRMIVLGGPGEVFAAHS